MFSSRRSHLEFSYSSRDSLDESHFFPAHFSRFQTAFILSTCSFVFLVSLADQYIGSYTEQKEAVDTAGGAGSEH